MKHRRSNIITGTLFLIACMILTSVSYSETILREFNNMDELGEFWNRSSWTGSNRTHSPDNVWIEDSVLVLKLSGSQPGELPVCAEITSKRSDFHYGSYTASIKTTDIAGAVVGWFVYLGSPLNEIDVEFLTQDISKVYFTLHHIETGVDHEVVGLDYDPSADFHEYRFDWYPDSVSYYIDGTHLATLTNQVPDMACKIMLNHWSGNIDGWGGPAPEQDVYMWVDYMQYSSEYPDSGETKADFSRPARNLNPCVEISQTADNLKISFNENASSPLSLSLFTPDGRNVFSKNGPTVKSLNLNTAALAAGAYILHIKGHGFFTDRIIHVNR